MKPDDSELAATLEADARRLRDRACDAASAAQVCGRAVLQGREDMSLERAVRELSAVLGELCRVEARRLSLERAPLDPVHRRVLVDACERLTRVSADLDRARDEGIAARTALTAVDQLRDYLVLVGPNGPRPQPDAMAAVRGTLARRRERLGQLAAAVHGTAVLAMRGDHEARVLLSPLVQRFCTALATQMPREHAWLRRLEHRGLPTLEGLTTVVRVREVARWLTTAGARLSGYGDQALAQGSLFVAQGTLAYLGRVARLSAPPVPRTPAPRSTPISPVRQAAA